MTPERSRQVQAIYQAAMARGPEDRAAFLDAACGADQELQHEVRSLLASGGRPTETLLDSLAAQPQESSPPPLVGQSVGPYRIVSVIGTGGMGVVYRAFDARLNRAVAIKAIQAWRPGNSKAERRLRAEALAAASLDHPYICKIYELIERPGGVLIAMEFVEGETLSAVLARGLPPVAWTIEIAREIAEGLANAHARNLVHRDVKPSNVMVTPHGHVKLLDFGLARLDVGSAPEAGTDTGPGHATALAGTPQYMAPEQATGGTITARADLFSLGVVLFECLTGKLPFTGRSGREYMDHLASDEPRSLAALAPQAPLDLVRLVDRCLRKSPADRPASASEVAAQLRAIGESLRAAGDPARAADLIRTRRRWQVVTGAVVLLAAAIVVWRWRTMQPDQAPVGRRIVVQTWASEERNSQISPDDATISFLSNRDGKVKLFRQAIGTSEARPLPLPDGEVLSHVWSPKGDELACAVRQGTQVNLLIVSAPAGGPARQTVRIGSALISVRLLRWTGRLIYFQVEDATGVSLQMVDLDRNAVTPVSKAWRVDGKFRGFDVRPDGGRVAFVVLDKRDQSDLWVANLDGSHAARVTDDASLKQNPLWRGGGETIIYESNRAGAYDLWEVSPDTGRTWALTASPEEDIPESTSADGALVSFQESSEDAKLWLWNPPGGQSRQLTASTLNDSSPALSPDGRMAVFQRSQPNPAAPPGGEILVAPFAGGPLDQARGLTAVGFAPSLSRDGSYVAHLLPPAQSPHVTLQIRPLRGGEPVVVTTTCQLPQIYSAWPEMIDRVFAWSPVSDTLYYVDNAGTPILRAYGIGASGPGSALVSGRPGQEISDIYPSADGKLVAYLTRGRNESTLAVVDLASGGTRTLALIPGSWLGIFGRGWLSHGREFTVVRRRNQYDDFTGDVEVLLVSLTGEMRRAGVLQHAFIGTSRLDSAQDVVYATRSVNGVYNVYGFSIRTGSLVQVTQNEFTGVRFYGVTPTGRGSVISVRDQAKRDVSLLAFGPLPVARVSGRGAPK